MLSPFLLQPLSELFAPLSIQNYCVIGWNFLGMFVYAVLNLQKPFFQPKSRMDSSWEQLRKYALLEQNTEHILLGSGPMQWANVQSTPSTLFLFLFIEHPFLLLM